MIVTELEREGIPAVQICNMVPVAESMGVSRICPSTSIKYPMGDPNLPAEEEKQLRRQMLEDALKYLLY